MDPIPPFSGFPQAGLDFLGELAENNSREWFEAHRATYEQELLAPAQSFIVALGTRLQAFSDEIGYDTRTDGRGVLMRIHRDTRFSADKSPYKTRLSGLFREGRLKKMESPAFGFQIDAEGIELIAGLHKFSPELLSAYRSAVLDGPTGAALAQAIGAVERAGGYRVDGRHLKRIPAGYDASYAHADLLRYDGLYSFSPKIPASAMGTPDLADMCYQHFQNMAPICTWLKGALFAHAAC
ncbi:DUF2461 domain-containing protein [Chloroflexia bacterium SDU3-3]|nr:DUF2461 domain-containing protein [Chloroflexia bacterium SDU3-3]